MSLSEKYIKAMNKITLSEEMKNSIIKNTSEAANKKNRPHVRPKYLKRAAGLAACFTICVLSYYITADNIGSSSDPYSPEINSFTEENLIADSNTQDYNPAPTEDVPEIPVTSSSPLPGSESQIDQSVPGYEGSPAVGSPVDEIDDIGRLENQLGYKIKIPEYLSENYAVKNVCLISGDIAEITYESENDTIYYRTAKGNSDISGDFNTYTDIETMIINDAEVTIKGNDNLFYSACWINSDESFSLYSDNGMEKEIMVSIIESTD